MLQRYLLIWLVLLSLLAYRWPMVRDGVRSHWPHSVTDAVRSDWDPFTETKSHAGQDRPYLTWLIVTTMFCVGSLLSRDEVTQLARRWPTVLGGTTLQYLSMPLLAYGLGHAFRLPPDLMLGVVMVGCVPGAMASNVLTLAARGNVSYSVSLTTLATLVSPVVVPLALALTMGGTANWKLLSGTSWQLLTQVVAPVLTGYTSCQLVPAWARLMQRIGGTIANLSILWIIAVAVALSRDRLSQITPVLLCVLLLINLGGYAAGLGGARLMRLPPDMSRALMLEIGMQNAGLGVVLALKLFKETPTAAIPPAAYAFGCMLTGTVLAQFLARRPVTSPKSTHANCEEVQ